MLATAVLAERKRFGLRTLFCVAVFALLLSACGGDGAPEERASAGAANAGGDAARAQVAGNDNPFGSPLKVVVLDPGHGGVEVGAAAPGLPEKESNLDMASRVRGLLERHGGLRVVLTRTEDTRAIGTPGDATGYNAQRADLQSRTDTANRERADVFVSLHSNGSSSADQSGVEVWYDGLRPFADENRRLAQLLLDNVMSELTGYGYPAMNRGVKDDACWRQRQDRCFQLFVLGPGRTQTREEIVRRGGDPDLLGLAPDQAGIATRPTEMPGALVESLFLSNPQDAAVLGDPAARDAIARGIARAILRFLGLDDGNV